MSSFSRLHWGWGLCSGPPRGNLVGYIRDIRRRPRGTHRRLPAYGVGGGLSKLKKLAGYRCLWAKKEKKRIKEKKKKKKRKKGGPQPSVQSHKRATYRTLHSRDPVLWFCSVGIRKAEARTDKISVGGRMERAHPGFAFQPSFDIIAVVPSASFRQMRNEFTVWAQASC